MHSCTHIHLHKYIGIHMNIYGHMHTHIHIKCERRKLTEVTVFKTRYLPLKISCFQRLKDTIYGNIIKAPCVCSLQNWVAVLTQNPYACLIL